MARSNTGSTSNYMLNGSAALTGLPITMACWANLANLTHTANLVAIIDESAGANYFSLLADGNNEYGGTDNAVVCDVGTGIFAKSTGTYTASAWHHFAATSSGMASRFAWLNGTAGPESTSTRSPSGWNRTGIGAFRVGSSTFSPINGSIAEVGIWNVVLTAAEMAMLADGYAPCLVRPDALVAHWPLIGRMASPEQDRWGNFHMTITGTMAQASHPPNIKYSVPVRVFVKAAAGGGGISTNLTPVSATGSVVTPTTTLSQSLTATSATGTAVAPTTSLSASVGAAVATASVVNVTTTLSQALTPVVTTGAGVAPTTTLSQALTTTSATATSVTPTTTLSHSVSPVVVTGSTVSVTSTLSQALSAVSATFSAVSTTEILGATTSLTPVTATFTGVTASTTLSTSLTPTSSTFSGVTTSETLSSSTSLTPVVATASVVTPLTQLSHALGVALATFSLPGVTLSGLAVPVPPYEDILLEFNTIEDISLDFNTTENIRLEF